MNSKSLSKTVFFHVRESFMKINFKTKVKMFSFYFQFNVVGQKKDWKRKEFKENNDLKFFFCTYFFLHDRIPGI